MGSIASRFAPGRRNVTSKTKIGDLPIDCLEHVFNFCDSKQLFRCMSVSREWNRAAKSAVFRRKCLSLGMRIFELRRLTSFWTTSVSLRSKKRGWMEQMLQSLSVMQCLTELYVSSLPKTCTPLHGIHHPEQLIDPERSRSFYASGKKWRCVILTILDCVVWRRNVVAVCPRLES